MQEKAMDLAFESLASHFFDLTDQARDVQRELDRQVRENHFIQLDETRETRTLFSSTLMTV